MTKYRFKERGHRHEIDTGDGFKRIKGVTTVINETISKGEKITKWAVNTTCGYIKENLKDIKDIDKVLKEALKEPNKEKERAGVEGKNLHLAIENYLKTGEIYKGQSEIVKRSFSNFLTWANKNSVVFLESEKNVYNEEMGLAGIIDGVALIDGKKWIVDFKSGKAIYKSIYLQLGFYDILLGQKIDGYLILNLAKDGTFQEERCTDTAEWKECSLACLKLYNKLLC